MYSLSVVFVLTLFLSPTESKALAITSKAPPAKDGAPRRSLNLEDYKKRRGLIWACPLCCFWSCMLHDDVLLFLPPFFSFPFWVGAAMELGKDSLKLPVICNINHSTIYCIDLPSCPSLCSPHKCGSVLFGVFPFLLDWVLFLFCWCSSLVHSVFSISLRSGFP